MQLYICENTDFLFTLYLTKNETKHEKKKIELNFGEMKIETNSNSFKVKKNLKSKVIL